MPDEKPTRQLRILAIAVSFELSLGILGVGILWVAGLSLQQVCLPRDLVRSAVVGVGAGALLMPVLTYLLASRWSPIIRLRDLVTNLVHDWLGDCSIWQLAVLSISAGIGEELLFRGAIQPVAAQWTSPLTGIIIASLIFGAVHAATPTYFVLATILGAYFGLLAWWQQEIVSAVIAHALYDFVALVFLLRRTEG